MTVAELVLVRHGESMGNVAAAAAHEADAEVIEVGQRDADVELSEVGQDQARALGIGLRSLLADDRPTLVWSSPYVRAQQTAALSLAAAGENLPVLVAGGRTATPWRPSGGRGSGSSTTGHPAGSPGPTWCCASGAS
jgi:phosphohistidine phosphatase SixA